ncbi:MAG TPA: helix-turn-helix domain-containing protein [Stellaceae bacterium]|nr:helix-turn-helix domain-containing protein [Stellaceae bacterium]
MLATVLHPETAAAGCLAAEVLAAARDDGGLSALDRIGSVITLRRDRALFREGDSAKDCHKVLTGALRSCRLLPDGRRHIGEFLLPGDFIGLDLDATRRFTAEAVSDATLMRYPQVAVERLIQQQPKLGKRLLAEVWNGLSAAQAQLLLLGRKNAVERVASFLLLMAQRAGDGDHFCLPMTRNDIADHLGLTTETVSRTFGQLKSQGVIRLAASSQVVLRDRVELEALAEAA